MSSIVKYKKNGITYLYESISYRNEDGKPRNKRTIIGKLDEVTDKPIYHLDYIEKMKLAGTPVEENKPSERYNEKEISSSSISEYGSIYFLENLAKKHTLLDSLYQMTPSLYNEIFYLASFLLCSNEPMMYCEDWMKSTYSPNSKILTPKYISQILNSLTQEERDAFYSSWCRDKEDDDYLALDITSISSYSKLIDTVGWGYNRDHEVLPQINMCMLFSEKSKLPIYQTIYQGELKDVVTLKATLTQMKLFDLTRVTIIMDKGFASLSNIEEMINVGMKFIISIPFTLKFVGEAISHVKDTILDIDHTIEINGDTLYASTFQKVILKGKKVYTHVYYNRKKAVGIEDSLNTHVTGLKNLALENRNNTKFKSEFDKYLIIRNSTLEERGYTVSINKEVVNKEIKNAGWIVIISNTVTDAKRVIQLYRNKDVVEKSFDRLKNNLDMDRLRVHSEQAMQNKAFISFISLILISIIDQVMYEKKLYDKGYTLKKLVKELSRLKIQIIKGHPILFPLTKQQKLIYDEFSMKYPVGILN
jgi:transposase